MAEKKINKLIELTKKMESKDGSKANSSRVQPIRSVSVSPLDQIKSIDEAFNAPYVPTEEEVNQWTPDKGVEEILTLNNKEDFENRLKNSGLPSAIKESMFQNPCTFNESIIAKASDPLNQFVDNLGSTLKQNKPKSGISAAQEINERLNKKDNNTTTKTVEQSHGSISLDSHLLEYLDRKFSELRNELEEIKSSNLKGFRVVDGNKFRFVDEDSNVYECELKKIGVMKKK